MKYRKIRFRSNVHGATAGLVIECSDHDKTKYKTIEELSRLFPITEALKMDTFERGPCFETWDEAFLYSFKEEFKEEPC